MYIPRQMTRLSTLIVVAAIGCLASSCHHEASSLEQQALREFVSKYWGTELFANECTGLGFDASAPLAVFVRLPGYEATLVNFAGFASFDLKDALTRGDTLEKVASLGVSDPGFGPISLGEFRFAKETPYGRPKDLWEPMDGYHLRFSSRVRFQRLTYLQVWVKGSQTSSGVRINFEFDDAGHLVRSQKMERACDDWG
jgi:hypothetical protein